MKDAVATLVRTVLAVGFAFACGLVHAAPPRVALETSLGPIVVELDPAHAPATTANFLRYVAEGHYDGTIIHRVVENFVVQGGGVTPDMTEKPTHEPIVDEARGVASGGLSNLVGTIAMARDAAVDSATSQFFINVADNVRLDHVDVPPEGITITRGGKDTFVPQSAADRVFGYAVFGRVVEGMDVVERIRHVPVHTVEAGETYENVPVDPIVLQKAVLLPTTNQESVHDR